MTLRVGVFLCLVNLATIHGGVPQVYEDNADDQTTELKENNRVVRDPEYRPRTIKMYAPPKFNYQETAQQDQRRHRYAQQQIVDMTNIVIKGRLNGNDGPLRLPLFQNYNTQNENVDHDQANETSSKIHRRTSALNKNKDSLDSVWDKVSDSTTRKIRSGRKLKPESYFDNQQTAIDRQDHLGQSEQIIYVNPAFLKQQPTKVASDQDINALSALIGQHPNNQLEGLRRLLHSQNQNTYQIKDHTPITEQTNDIPNTQSMPNIKTEPAANQGALQETIKAIQAQLDETAKVQAEQALAKARLEAEAQVEAQHQAIIRAQQAAHKAALAKIAAHNQAYEVPAPSQPNLQVVQVTPHGSSGQQVVHPLALPLKSEIVQESGHTYAPSHQHQVASLIQAQAQKAQALKQAQAQARAQAHAQAQVLLLRSQQEALKKNIAKISITKTHSITQQHHSPNAYQQVVLETQHREPSSKPPYSSDNVDEQQYASRYAFGYRIRDVKMGNDFGHEEKRDGKSAKGQYHVLLPDGRLQKVEYYADPSGYHAKVTYENVAHH